MTVEEKIANLQAQLDELKKSLGTENNRVVLADGDIYLFVDEGGNVFQSQFDSYSAIHNHRKDFNNVFCFKKDESDHISEHLQWYAENVIRVQNRLMQLHEQLCPDYFPDWNDMSYKWTVFLNSSAKKWETKVHTLLNYSTVYFTEEAAEAAAEILDTEKFMME